MLLAGLSSSSIIESLVFFFDVVFRRRSFAIQNPPLSHTRSVVACSSFIIRIALSQSSN